jgi:UDP-N-acetylglucosamine:LPS N-acetylglucosamine transferase
LRERVAMNILILSSKFGMGHQMVAKAIKERIENSDKDARVFEVDLFAWLHPRSQGMVIKGFHILVAYFSVVYNVAYRIWGRTRGRIKEIRKGQYRMIEELMQRYEPEVVVCTIPIWGKVVVGYLRKSGSKVPLITYVTDFDWHPVWMASEDGIYLVPSHGVKTGLVAHGVDENAVFVTGLPVRKEFWQEKEKSSKLRIEKRVGRIKEILVMGGGLGIFPRLGRLIRYLHGVPGVHVTVVMGNNRRLYRRWKGRYRDVEVLGYTERIWDYMKKADLVISKAGGVTLFELVACEVPIFVIHPFLRQEVENARFIERMGIGKVAWKSDGDFVPVLWEVIGDSAGWARMKERMRKMQEKR